MELYAVKTEIVRKGDSLVGIALDAMRKQNLQLEDDDVLVFTSKIVSIAEGRTTRLSSFKPSAEAKKLAGRFDVQPEFAQAVLHEAEAVYGGVEKAVLTLRDGVLAPNAGIDNKNAPEGFVVLWPKNPRESAKNLREELVHVTGKQIGVLIVDSGLVPLRIGTVGLALAVAGFKPIKDVRGDKDLHGKLLIMTRHAVADDLASAAHLLMGEAAERTPIVLIKDAPVEFDDRVYGGSDMTLRYEECVFIGAFLRCVPDSTKA